VCMLGAMVAATAAQAEGPTEPLRWRVETKVLAANETREITITRWIAEPITAESKEPVVLVGGNLRVECFVAKAGANPYLANQTQGAVAITSPEFSKCKAKGNGEPCEIKEPIKVKRTIGVAALNDVEKKVGKKILARFEPTSSSEFASLEFTGSGCKINPIIVKGIVLGSFFTDPLVAGGSTPEPLEIETTGNNNAETERSSVLLKFPDSEKSVFLWSGTAWSLFELTTEKELKAGSNAATLTGNFLILLSNGGRSTGEKFSTVK